MAVMHETSKDIRTFTDDRIIIDPIKSKKKQQKISHRFGATPKRKGSAFYIQRQSFFRVSFRVDTRLSRQSEKREAETRDELDCPMPNNERSSTQ